MARTNRAHHLTGSTAGWPAGMAAAAARQTGGDLRVLHAPRRNPFAPRGVPPAPDAVTVGHWNLQRDSDFVVNRTPESAQGPLPADDLYRLVRESLPPDAERVRGRDFAERRARRIMLWLASDRQIDSAWCTFDHSTGLFVARSGLEYADLWTLRAGNTLWDSHATPWTAVYRLSPFPWCLRNHSDVVTEFHWVPSQGRIEYTDSDPAGRSVWRRVSGLHTESALFTHFGTAWRARIRGLLRAAVAGGRLTMTQAEPTSFYQAQHVMLEAISPLFPTWATEYGIALYRAATGEGTQRVVDDVVVFHSIEEQIDCVVALFWMHGVLAARGETRVRVQLPHVIGPGWMAVRAPVADHRLLAHVTPGRDGEAREQQRIAVADFLGTLRRDYGGSFDPGLRVLDELAQLAQYDLMAPSPSGRWDGIGLTRMPGGALQMIVYSPF